MKFESGEVLDHDETSKNERMRSQLGVFALSYCKRIMKEFIRLSNINVTNSVQYKDTDSLHTDEKPFAKLNGANNVGEELGQGKNFFLATVVFFNASFWHMKLNYVQMLHLELEEKKRQRIDLKMLQKF